jgi:hypothetical protein
MSHGHSTVLVDSLQVRKGPCKGAAMLELEDDLLLMCGIRQSHLKVKQTRLRK